MRADQSPVELVGGPVDGQIRVLQGEPTEISIPEFRNGIVIDHLYRRREINGVVVRLSNKRIPYDWVNQE